MTFPFLDTDLADRAEALLGAATPFAVATVVRAVGSTAAAPGARALVLADGSIECGFLGGGCLSGAVGRAARQALDTGAPVSVAMRPPSALEDAGVQSGETRDGLLYARNGCPSEGSVDVFVEPVLPRPVLAVCGAGPVAGAILRQAAAMDFDLLGAARDGAPEGLPEGRSQAGFENLPGGANSYVIVATQGAGDAAALLSALATSPAYIGFLGSRRKFAQLAKTLIEKGADPEALARVHSPAGLHIGAQTPGEIALSILAEVVQVRRQGDAP